ncbi:MAG: LSM domain-containing protein [Euryarchaeota archaeon]|nr:LSM domain-containing protein [Euryarchaeota archaeon]
MSENRPLDIVHKSLDKEVIVILKDGRTIKGTLIGYDTDLNLSIGNAEVSSGDTKKMLGTVVIRKNNVRSFSPQDMLQ